MRYTIHGVRVRLGICAAMLSLALAGTSRLAGQEKELGAFYNAELTFVFTSGNAKTNTLGVGAGFRYVWERTELSLRGTALRTETGTISRTAVGTVDDFEVVEDTDTNLTAENYALRARLDRTLSSRLFAFGG
ncbi:MAG: DUF481 domain-containing protein, partial [Gemmatimonadota bacterium]|nr:DUF481 domain-containing protein [Gemmatimonadota bacterium]